MAAPLNCYFFLSLVDLLVMYVWEETSLNELEIFVQVFLFLIKLYQFLIDFFKIFLVDCSVTVLQ